jgi:hypothetical protein
MQVEPVPMFQSVPGFEPECLELKPKQWNTTKNATSQGFSPDIAEVKKINSVPVVPSVIETAMLAKLAGVTIRAVNQKITRKGINAKENDGTKNQIPIEVAFKLFPAAKTAWEVQNQLNIHIQEATERLQEEAAKPEHPIETRPMSDREVARLWHLQRIDEVIREKGCGTKPAIRLYAARLVDKRVELPDWVASFYPEPSFDTLYLWHTGLSGLGHQHLLPSARRPKRASS